MRVLSGEDLKKRELEILSDVHEFCEKHGLRYFLAYGTLLGAVRHKGFIPWDDDIDITMPREDYDVFIKIYPNEKSRQRFQLRSACYTENYPYPFAKVIDSETILLEEMFQSYSCGVYIDVFPIEVLGNSKNEALKIVREVRQMWELASAKFFTLKFKRSLLGRIKLILKKIFCFYQDGRKILTQMEKRASCFRQNTENEWGGVILGSYEEKEVVPAEWHKEFQYMEFEGEMFRVPVSYDNVLRAFYGNYMEMPPIEERRAHHFFEVYLKENKL